MELPVIEYKLQPQIDEMRRLYLDHFESHSEDELRKMYLHHIPCSACEMFRDGIVHLYNVSLVRITMSVAKQELPQLPAK